MKFSSNVPATPGDYKWRQTEGGTEYLATLRLLNGGLVQVDVPFEVHRDPAAMGGQWATHPEA